MKISKLLAAALLALGLALPASGQANPKDVTPIFDVDVDHIPLNHHPAEILRDEQGMPRRSGVFNTTTTTNWSGYVVDAGGYFQVSGRWQLPGATWGQTNANPFNLEYNTIWVGIGGFNDGTLIQMGTETTVNPSNQVTQYLWYELYPAGSVAINEPIATGDIINAQILCTANCTPGATQTWQMTIKNETKGWTWQQNFQFASSMVSAEWVVESPYYNGFLPLNNYAQANWDSAMANNVNQGLTVNNGLALNDAAGQTSNPSDTLNGNQFSTCYGFGTFTPCPVGSIGGGPPPPPAVPTVALSANPSSIAAGQSATLSWSSSNATSCTGSNFTPAGTSGSLTVTPAYSTSYSITCTGSGGSASGTASVAVGSGTSCHKKHCRAALVTPPRPPLRVSFDPLNPTIPCGAGPGTLVSHMMVTGGSGNPVAWSLLGDTTDFLISETDVLVSLNGVDPSTCGTVQNISVSGTQQD